MTQRSKIAAGLAAAGALMLPFSLSQGGGTVDVFVGSTPTPTATAVPNIANLWVDGSGTCTRQGTAGAYNSAAACTDIAAAYTASSADDVIRIKAGTYSTAQNLSGSHGTAGHPVTITVAQGEAPSITGEVQFQSSHIVFKGESAANKINAGIYICKVSVSPTCASSSSSITAITIQYLDNAGSYWIRGGNNITIRDSVFHDWNDFTSQLTDVDTVLIENSVFRDAHLVTPGSHTDCMGIFGGTSNVTVRSSKFYNCEHADILVDYSVTGTYNTNLVLENNYFDDVLTPGVNVGLTRCNSGCVVRYNTFGPTMSFNQVADTAGALVYGNMIAGGSSGSDNPCTSATWTYNTWGGTGCAGTGNSSSATLGWTSTSATGGASDFHLASCAASAVNSGHPSLYPTTDYDGTARPVGSGADRGAFEKAGC